MGFTPLMSLAAAVSLMGGAACSVDDDQGRTADESAPAVPTADAGAPALSSSTPTALANGPVPGEIVGVARKYLAAQLDVDEGSFKLDGSESVAWADASLGCPQEGMGYAQVVTPGYRLMFDLAGTPYSVHTDSDGSHMVICGEGQ